MFAETETNPDKFGDNCTMDRDTTVLLVATRNQQGVCETVPNLIGNFGGTASHALAVMPKVFFLMNSKPNLKAEIIAVGTKLSLALFWLP